MPKTIIFYREELEGEITVDLDVISNDKSLNDLLHELYNEGVRQVKVTVQWKEESDE